MSAQLPPSFPSQVLQPPRRSLGRYLVHALWVIVALLVALAALVAYEHYSLVGDHTPAMVSLGAAGVFGLVPVRAVLHLFFAVERRALHLVHGIGGLALIAATASGVVPRTSLLSHGAEAPFAMMGAAQALMHQNQPRNAAQAAALRQFATSLPEVSVFSRPGALTSPANAARAVAVLSDLITKAEALGETELRSDPAFQSAWQRATTHVGLSLGLDAIDRAIGTLAANPATAAAVPDLRKRLAVARKTNGG